MVYLEEEQWLGKFRVAKSYSYHVTYENLKCLSGGEEERKTRDGQKEVRRKVEKKKGSFLSLLPNENSFTAIDILCLTRLHK